MQNLFKAGLLVAAALLIIDMLRRLRLLIANVRTGDEEARKLLVFAVPRLLLVGFFGSMLLVVGALVHWLEFIYLLGGLALLAATLWGAHQFRRILREWNDKAQIGR